ncbi:sigma-70 family RNA polymerase sigma factor [bacterium]|nr:sigma-70 family RNA polymerase sigma factor [bacterium]
MNEKEILKGCINNDRRSQNALYKKYFPLMSSIARRYCKEHEQVELINEGFLKVLQSIRKYKSDYSLATWIRTILVRTMIDHYRSSNSDPEHVEYNPNSETLRESSVNRAEAKLQSEDLRQLLNQLPNMTGKVFNLFAIDGFKHKEIADLLGITEGTSKWHLAEARKRLKAALEKLEENEKKMEVLRNEA